VRVAAPRSSAAGKLSSTMNCVDDDGAADGANVGCFVGNNVGVKVGCRVGVNVGATVGCCVGVKVGAKLG
jgi:phage tail tape-measure protein